MDELRRRYLAQQVELGGSEVILPAGEAPASRGTPIESPAPEASADAASIPKWLRGAPPIPGPGLAITSPDPVLLGSDLARLSTLDAVAERIRGTQCCGLCSGRTNAVPGEGNPNARLVLVGEGPGATEDATGRPFVGQAGKLLEGISGGY